MKKTRLRALGEIGEEKANVLVIIMHDITSEEERKVMKLKGNKGSKKGAVVMKNTSMMVVDGVGQVVSASSKLEKLGGFDKSLLSKHGYLTYSCLVQVLGLNSLGH